jgi:alkylation response protein AidB-like acyl-CoA dehydrogenase
MDDVTAFDTPPVRTLAADLRSRVEAVAQVAAAHADAVDRDARFPGEAFEAARKARLPGLLVPAELGGGGGTVSDAAEVCHALGRACALPILPAPSASTAHGASLYLPTDRPGT